MNPATTARYAAFVKASKAARLNADCSACASFARTGMPLQCNRCRSVMPDALTQYAGLYGQAADIGCDDVDALVNAVLDTLKAA